MINMQNVHVSKKFRHQYETMALGDTNGIQGEKQKIAHENKFNELKT